ncbi:MAG: hypothetical protein QXT90_04160 [Candidatus Caldarchaeum sp.]
MPNISVAARLKELKDQYLVFAVERGGYTVQLAKLQEILDSVERSMAAKAVSRDGKL